MTVLADRPVRRPSRTRKRLTGLLAALLIAAVATLTTAVIAVTQVFGTAATVRDHTTQAVLEVAAARAALIDADQAAVDSFRTGDARLAGPGQAYTNALASANQSLAKAAESNQAGAPGTSRLQVVEGLLSAYSGQVEQADAHFRQPGLELLGITDLWDASRVLHGSDGVLSQLKVLQDEQRAALDTQLDDGMSPALLPVWLLAPAVLFAVLLGAQWYLWRRFRRRVNPALLGATVLVLGVGVTLGFVLAAQQRLDDVRAGTDTVLAQREAEMSETDARGQTELAQVLATKCAPAGCGPTVADFHPAAAPSESVTREDAIEDATQTVVSEAAAAAGASGIEVLVPAFCLGAAALVVLGFSFRIDEYRYRT